MVSDQFEKIGSRAEVYEASDPRVNIQTDRSGEFFTIGCPSDADVQVLNVDRDDRHLVLLIKHGRRGAETKERFLCGHDERNYFVAAVPDAVTTVRDAKASLRPRELGDIQVKPKDRNKRRTENFIRQGEWFFVPEPDFKPGDAAIHPHEPIQRSGGSKAHTCEEVCRHGGEVVYVSGTTVLTQTEFDQRIAQHPQDRRRGWNTMLRGAAVHARGAVRHADHATIHLNGWHRVLLNGEGGIAAASVAFLD